MSWSSSRKNWKPPDQTEPFQTDFSPLSILAEIPTEPNWFHPYLNTSSSISKGWKSNHRNERRAHSWTIPEIRWLRTPNRRGESTSLALSIHQTLEPKRSYVIGSRIADKMVLLELLVIFKCVPHRKELCKHLNHDRFSYFQHCNDQELVQCGMQLSHAFPMAEVVYPLQ